CPRCIKSKGEERIELYLKENAIIFKPEHVLKKGMAKRSRFDFAVRRLGAVALVEYHGWQHYMPYSFSPKKDKATMIRNLVGSIRRDHRKETWSREKGIPLLVIPYWDYKRIEEILDHFFAGREPTFSEPPEIVRKYESMRQKILERIKETGPIKSVWQDRPDHSLIRMTGPNGSPQFKNNGEMDAGDFQSSSNG